MSSAALSKREPAKLLTIDAGGTVRDVPRTELASLFSPGDLVVANDAATLPASLRGIHEQSGKPVEVRLAAWVSAGDPSRFIALAFGAGDHRMRTEDRAAPPPLSSGDHLSLGPLAAIVARLLGHPRLVALRFLGKREAVLGGIARHGQPIQYAHAAEPLALWDVWTRIAANPVAFEPPSAGFALDWRILGAWRRRGIGFATLTHAAGISSTGDPALDLRLPFDEPYCIPVRTAAASQSGKVGRRTHHCHRYDRRARARSHRGGADGRIRARNGVASGRIGRGTRLRVVDAILTGVHQAGESHFELLEAFANDEALSRISGLAVSRGYRTHEFGDSMLIEHQTDAPTQLGIC